MSDNDTKSSENARNFWYRAQSGNWDAIVVPESRFTQLGLSVELQEHYQQKRIDELNDSIVEAKNLNGDKDFRVKALERMRKQAEQKINHLRSKKEDIQGISFDALGVDMLIVDEAHGFKNLATGGMQIAGLGGASSATKCEDLLDKCDYLRSKDKGGNIVFLTGTPVSNTMSELYNMQRYLAPKLLKTQGVFNFTLWANTFGEVVDSVEVKPEGGGFQVKSRFAKFHNLPELMADIRTFSDFVLEDDVDLKLPEIKPEPVPVEAAPSQKEEMEILAERGEAVRKGSVDATVDNLLKITNDGRKLALDPKLLYPDNPTLEPLENGKVDVCVKKTKELWDKTMDTKGAQLIFCDSSTDSGINKGKFNIYDDIKRRLIDEGIPANEIASIGETSTSASKREELFRKVQEGEVRVLIGSTQKLGTGTNVQDRLIAIHDLDVPWRPSDLEQRLGRIKRQGNMYDKAYCYRYITVGSFDAYIYQILERKQSFISQVITNKNPARTAEDLDEVQMSYAQIKAIATGDPKIQERLMLENEVKVLESQRNAYYAGMERLKEKQIQKIEPALRFAENILNGCTLEKKLIDRATEGLIIPDEFGNYNEQAKHLNERLCNLAARLEATQKERIGLYCGIEVYAWRKHTEELFLGIKTHYKDKPTYSSEPLREDAFMSLNKLIKNYDTGYTHAKQECERYKQELDSLQDARKITWDKEAEYQKKKAEYQKYLDEDNKKEEEAKPKEPNDFGEVVEFVGGAVLATELGRVVHTELSENTTKKLDSEE